MIIFTTKNAQQTKDIASKLAGCLKKQDILGFTGDLGAGKTTFIKGLAAGLDINEQFVTSPTFLLIKEYKGKIPLYHFDLYRLKYIDEIELLGYRDYFYSDGITCIEWAEKIKKLLPLYYLRINIKIKGNNQRKITFNPHNERLQNCLEEIKKDFKL
jgi:tRNA threonylcarbamoyladenosine biosynthesis protein TsaE